MTKQAEAEQLMEKIEEELDFLHKRFDEIEYESNKHEKTYREDFSLQQTIEFLGKKVEYLHQIITVLGKIQEYEKRIQYAVNNFGVYNINDGDDSKSMEKSRVEDKCDTASDRKEENGFEKVQ